MFENWRDKKWKIKGQISSSSLISVQTIYLPTVHVCTMFQPSRPHSSWEKNYKNFNVWKLERKNKEERKGRIRGSSLIPVCTIHLPPSMCVPSFNLLGLIVPEKSVTKNFNVWKSERKKKELKGPISSSSLIPVQTIHLPLSTCELSFNLLGLTVPEKSVTKKF